MTLFFRLNSTPLNGTDAPVVSAELLATDTAYSSEQANLVTERLLSATGLAQSDGQGSFGNPIGLSATDTATSSESAALVTERTLQAADLAQSDESFAMDLPGELRATDTATSDESFGTTVEHSLSVADTTYAQESAYLAPGLAATDTAQALAQANVTVERKLAAALDAQANESFRVTVERGLSATVPVQAWASAMLVQARRLGAKDTSFAVASANVRVLRKLSAAADARSDGRATLVTAKPLSATDTAHSNEWATLFTKTPQPHWHTPPVRIGGIPVELPCAIDYSEEAEDVGGLSKFRLADGTDLNQTYWLRKKITMSGSGFAPHGLDELDWTVPQVVEGTLFPPFEAMITKSSSAARFGQTRWIVEAVEK